MKPILYKPTGKWRIIIPPSLTGTGKRQRRFFETKTAAEAEVRRILHRGNSSKPKVSESDEAAFTLAKEEGLSPQEYLDAIRLYKKMVKGVASEKRIDL